MTVLPTETSPRLGTFDIQPRLVPPTFTIGRIDLALSALRQSTPRQPALSCVRKTAQGAPVALRPLRCHELARPRTNLPRAEVALQQDLAGTAEAVP